MSYAFEPGEIQYEVTHPEYEPGSCVADDSRARARDRKCAETLKDAEEDAFAAPPEGDREVEVECELTALPRKGSVRGTVIDETGAPVSGAKVSVGGPAAHELVTDGNGQFNASDLQPGTYSALIDSEKHLVKVEQFDVRAREEANANDLRYLSKPKRSAVRISKRALKFKGLILFETDSDAIKLQSEELLIEIADAMIRHPELARIEIQGHTDNRGGKAHNQDLSERRAQSVLRWLVDHGVGAERLESKGYGQTKPLAPNITARNRAKNRRVQFVIRERAPKE